MAHWEYAIAKRTVTGAFVFSAARAYQNEKQQQKTAHTALQTKSGRYSLSAAAAGSFVKIVGFQPAKNRAHHACFVGARLSSWHALCEGIGERRRRDAREIEHSFVV